MVSPWTKQREELQIQVMMTMRWTSWICRQNLTTPRTLYRLLESDQRKDIADPHSFQPGNDCTGSNLNHPDLPGLRRIEGFSCLQDDTVCGLESNSPDHDFQTRTKSGLRRKYLQTSSRDNILKNYRIRRNMIPRQLQLKMME